VISEEQSLKDGKLLPVMEEFYSLQGEGFHTGQAAWFIRIGGCDVGCRWCDVKESWNACLFPPIPADGVVERASGCPAGAVVITGGEPLLYNLNYLCSELKARNIRTFLETSGSSGLSGEWDWICLSPKRDNPPVPGIHQLAHELKMIIHEPGDLSWAEENAALVSPGCLLYLQPEWSRVDQMMELVTGYVKMNPRWRISLQSHKYMGIP
jgi:organic radical activating enzyme